MGNKAPASLSRRLAWFFTLWLAGVVTVAALAYIIRILFAL